jgi:PAS domain S-box-containing protein
VTHNRSIPCQPPNDICPMKVALETGKTFVAEHIHIDKNNNQHFVEITCFPVINPEDKKIIVHITKDVTERKKSEEKIRLLSSAVEQTPTGLVVSDLKGYILYVNPGWLKLHNFAENEAEDLIGQWIMKFYYRQPIEILNYDVKPGSGFRGRIKQVRKDGTTFMSLTVISPIRNTNGEIIWILHSVRNLTEIVRDINTVKSTEFSPIKENQSDVK